MESAWQAWSNPSLLGCQHLSPKTALEHFSSWVMEDKPSKCEGSSHELKCCQKTGGNFTALWRCGHSRKRFGCFWKCPQEQWICEIIVRIHCYISSHPSPPQITAAFGIIGKGRTTARVVLYPQLSHQGISIWDHQEQICKEGGVQWQWIAAFLPVTWEILPLLDTLPAWLYFTLSWENSEYSLNFAWQLMQAHGAFWGLNSCSDCWQLMLPGWPLSLTFVPGCSFSVVKKEKIFACMATHGWHEQERCSEGWLTSMGECFPFEAK